MLARRVADGVVKPPRYLPPMFRDLNGLAIWMAYSTFFSQLGGDAIADHYARLFARAELRVHARLSRRPGGGGAGGLAGSIWRSCQAWTWSRSSACGERRRARGAVIRHAVTTTRQARDEEEELRRQRREVEHAGVDDDAVLAELVGLRDHPVHMRSAGRAMVSSDRSTTAPRRERSGGTSTNIIPKMTAKPGQEKVRAEEHGRAGDGEGAAEEHREVRLRVGRDAWRPAK